MDANILMHMQVLLESSSVWVTGGNAFGQLGDGSTNDKLGFVKVVDSDAKDIAAGNNDNI